MASSVAPLALSHAMRRWNRNSPNDKQTRAAAVDTLRAEDELELVGAIEVLAAALGDEASLRWVSGAGAPGAAPALGLTASWLHEAVVRWVLRFLVLAAARHGHVLVCRGAEGNVEAVACVHPPSALGVVTAERASALLSDLPPPPGDADAVLPRAAWLWRRTSELRAAALPPALAGGNGGAKAHEPGWHLTAIAVAPDVQGRGLGGLLLGEFAALAAVSRNRSTVVQCAAPTVAFFRAKGYTTRSRVRTSKADMEAMEGGHAPYPQDGPLRVLSKAGLDRTGRPARL